MDIPFNRDSSHAKFVPLYCAGEVYPDKDTIDAAKSVHHGL